MNVDLIPLSSWIEKQFKDYQNTPPVRQKEEVANDLGVGVSTIYRWLKEGNRYIQLVGSDDDVGLIVWTMENKVYE